MWFNPKTGSWQFGDEPSWTADYVEKARAEQEERDRLEADRKAQSDAAAARREAQLQAGMLPGDMADTTLSKGERFAQGVEGSFVGDYGRYLGRLGDAAYRASEKSGGFAGPLATGREFALQEQAVAPEEKGILGRAQDAYAGQDLRAGDDSFLEEYEKISKASRAREADATRQTELAGGGGFMGDVAQFGGQMLGDLPVYAAIPEVGAEALGLRLGGGRVAQLAAETAMNLPTDVASGLALEKLRGRDDSLGMEIGGAIGGRALLGGAGKLIGKGLEARQLRELAPDLDAAGRKEFEQGMGRVRQEFGQAGMEQGRIGVLTGNEEAKKAIAASKIVRIAALTGKDPVDVARNLRVKGFIDEDTMLEAIAEQAKLEPEVVRAKLGDDEVPKGATVGRNVSLGPKADFSTSVHELMHALQSNLKPEDMARLESWAGVKAGDWNEAAMEKVAEGFERFVAQGQAPKSKLGEIFQQASKWVGEAYSGKTLPGDEDLGQARGVFEGMIGASSPGSRIEAGAANAAKAFDADEPLFQKGEAVVDESIPDTPETGIFAEIKQRIQSRPDVQSITGKRWMDMTPEERIALGDQYGTNFRETPLEEVGKNRRGEAIMLPGGKEGEYTYGDLFKLKELAINPGKPNIASDIREAGANAKKRFAQGVNEDLEVFEANRIYDEMKERGEIPFKPINPEKPDAPRQLIPRASFVASVKNKIREQLKQQGVEAEMVGHAKQNLVSDLEAKGEREDLIPLPMHTSIHEKLAKSLQPKTKGLTREQQLRDIFSRIIFGQTSANTGLLSNQFYTARVRPRSAEDVDLYAQIADAADAELDAAPEGTRQKVEAILNNKLRRWFGISSAASGGAGISASVGPLNVMRAARLFKKNPEWFMKGKLETFPEYQARLTAQLPFLGTKTGSFATLLTDPWKSEVTAVDLHWARNWIPEYLKDVTQFPTLTKNILLQWNTQHPESPVTHPSQIFGRDHEPESGKLIHVGDHGGEYSEGTNLIHDEIIDALSDDEAVYRMAKTGEINEKAPATLQKDGLFIEEPDKVKKPSVVYEAIRNWAASKADPDFLQGPSGHRDWDRYRERMEPHETAATEGSLMPLMDFDSFKASLDAAKRAGYNSDGGLEKLAKVPSSEQVYFQTGKAELEKEGQNRLFEGAPVEKPQRAKKRPAPPTESVPAIPKDPGREPGKRVTGQVGEDTTPPVKTRPVPPEKWMEDEDAGYPKAVEKIYAAAAAKEGPGKNGVIANSEAKAVLGVGAKTARDILKKMTDQGLLTPTTGGARRLARPAKEIVGAFGKYQKEARAFDSDIKKEEALARRANEEEWQKRTLSGAAPPPKKPRDPNAPATAVPDPDESFIEPQESVTVGLRSIEDGEKPPPGRKSGHGSWFRNQLTPIRHRLAGGYLGKEGQRFGVLEEATNEAQDRFLSAAAEPLARLNKHLTQWGKDSKGSFKESAKESLAGQGYSAQGKAFLNEIRDYMIAKTLKDEEYLASGKVSEAAREFGEDLLAVSREFGARLEELQVGVHTEEQGVRAFKMRDDWAIPLLFAKDPDKGYSVSDSGRAGAYGGSVFRERGTDIKQIWASYKDPKKDTSEALPDGDEFYTRMREYFERASRVSAEAENFGYARKNGQLWMEDSLDGMLKKLQEAQGADDAKKRYVDEVIAKAYGKRQYDTLDQYVAMVGTAEASSKLFPFSALPQFVQGSHIMAKTGFSKALIEGLTNVFTDDMKAAIAKSGGTTDSLMQGLPKSFRDAPFAMKVLGDLSRKIALMPNRKADQMMRHVAGSTGKKWAERLALDLVGTGPKSKVAEVELKRLGIDPAKVRDQGGMLSEKQAEQAITRFIRRTQTTSGALEQVGGLAGSPSKQVLFQFMGFMVKNAFLIGDEVAGGIGRAWKAGDKAGALNRLAAYGVASAALGAGSVAVRDLLTSKKYKEGQGPVSAENVSRYASQALAIDTFGRMLEAYDREDKIGMAPLGPAVRDTLNIVESIFDVGWLAKNKLTGEKWLESEDTRPLSERARDLVREKKEAGEKMSMAQAVSALRRKGEDRDLERRFKIQSFKDKAISAVPASRTLTQGYSKLKGRDYREDRVRRVKLYAKPRSEKGKQPER